METSPKYELNIQYTWNEALSMAGGPKVWLTCGILLSLSIAALQILIFGLGNAPIFWVFMAALILTSGPLYGLSMWLYFGSVIYHLNRWFSRKIIIDADGITLSPKRKIGWHMVAPLQINAQFLQLDIWGNVFKLSVSIPRRLFQDVQSLDAFITSFEDYRKQKGVDTF